MGESFGNLVQSVLEKVAKPPLYNSDAIRIDQFEYGRARPKSEEFKRAYPELYNFLLTGKPEGKFKVGIIHLDGRGLISKERANDKKTPVSTLFKLEDLLRAELVKIAKEMKDNPTSEMGKLEYLTGGSRLFRARRVAESVGFEIFEMDDDEKMKFKSASHKRARGTYKISNALGTTNIDLKSIEDKEAKIGLISREAILKLLPDRVIN